MALRNFIPKQWARWRLSRPISLRKKDQSLGNQELGQLGERLAGWWLQAEGRRVIYRNYRAPEGGEVDLVTRDGNLLAFVEVKTRRAGGVGRPLDAVDKKKRSLIRKGGLAWLQLLNKPEVIWRHDVVEILVREGERPHVSLIKNIETGQSRSDHQLS